MHIIGKGRVLILKKFGIVCVLMALLCCIMAPNASAREVVDIDRFCSLTVSLRSDIDFDHEFLLYQLFDVDSQSETGDVHFVVNEEYRDCVIHALNKIGVSDIQEDNLAQTVLNVCNDPDNKRYDFLFAIRKSIHLVSRLTSKIAKKTPRTKSTKPWYGVFYGNFRLT